MDTLLRISYKNNKIRHVHVWPTHVKSFNFQKYIDLFNAYFFWNFANNLRLSITITEKIILNDCFFYLFYSDLDLFAIFEIGHIAADQICFNEFNSNNKANLAASKAFMLQSFHFKKSQDLKNEFICFKYIYVHCTVCIYSTFLLHTVHQRTSNKNKCFWTPVFEHDIFFFIYIFTK